jgi:FkbM family methyltransferase
LIATHPLTTPQPANLRTRLNSRLLWWTMRRIPFEQWLASRRKLRIRLLEWALLRGDVQVFGGLAPRTRLAAKHFQPWGAQAFALMTGTHEATVQEALRRHLPQGGTLIDVGSNIGGMALVAAAIVGPDGQVVALDPQAECAEAARVNAGRNGFSHMTVVNAAAGATCGKTEIIVVADSLWTRSASVGEHELEIRRDTVALITLDELVASGQSRKPDVVKIDVEGAELDVVAGMKDLLRDVRPIVICEMHGKNEAFAEAMAQARYRVSNLDSPEAIATGDPNAHALCEPL